jgi:AI-2 transport protein TqsA
MGRSQDKQPGHQREDFRSPLLWVIALAAAVWLIKETFSFTMPITFGLILAMLLFPIQRATASRVSRSFRWLGTVAAVASLLVCVAAFILFIAFVVNSMTDEAPRYAEQYQNLREWVEQYGVTLPAYGNGSGAEDERPPGQNAGDSAGSEQMMSVVRTVFMRFWELAALSILVFFFTLLMLVEVDSWRRRIPVAIKEHSETIFDVVEVIADKVRTYLLVRTIVSLITGFAAGTWFWAIGLDFWYLWGFLAFVLNYIPFVGSIIASIPPVLLALAIEGWGMGLLAAGGSLAINNVIGNFIDPRLEGEKLSVSPVVLLAGLVFWSWAWGWPGAFLAIPLTTALLVVLAHTDQLKSVALLLSQSHSVRELDRNMGSKNQ